MGTPKLVGDQKYSHPPTHAPRPHTHTHSCTRARIARERKRERKHASHAYTQTHKHTNTHTHTPARIFSLPRILDPDGRLFRGRISSRDDYSDGKSNRKSIRNIFPCDISMAVIVDDREDVWRETGQRWVSSLCVCVCVCLCVCVRVCGWVGGWL